MKKNESIYAHLLLLIIVLAVFIWSAIKPASYLTWAMEVLPAVVGVVIAIIVYNRFRLTNISYLIISSLAVLMFVGGHYTYSKVPLFNWIKDALELDRNHYDRFGHLTKGLFAIVIREILIRKTRLARDSWLFIIALSISLAIAALYEIIEWLTSKIMHGGKAAKDFLGTQGDIWDTQWDMSLMLIGSLLALLLLAKIHDRQLGIRRTES